MSISESQVPEIQEYNPEAQEHDFDYAGDNYEIKNSNILVPLYNEREVTVVDWGQDVFGNPLQKIQNYLISLFPIARWILHYNRKWLYGDLIAGITVGVV